MSVQQANSAILRVSVFLLVLRIVLVSSAVITAAAAVVALVLPVSLVILMVIVVAFLKHASRLESNVGSGLMVVGAGYTATLARAVKCAILLVSAFAIPRRVPSWVSSVVLGIMAAEPC